MQMVRDTVNDNLNQFTRLRLEAEGHVSEDTLTLFDNALRDTAAELTALGSTESFAEKPKASGPGVNVSAPRAPR